MKFLQNRLVYNFERQTQSLPDTDATIQGQKPGGESSEAQK